jgi:predicted DNA-binding transcriptional regulator AlpA
VNTTFLLMAKYDSVTLTLRQVCDLLDKRPQTIRNRMALGTFPQPTEDEIWRVQDVADWFDRELVEATGVALDRMSPIFDDLRTLVREASAKAVLCGQPMVYLLLQGPSDVVYVGMSRAHVTRMYTHLRLSEKEFDRISMIACESIEEAANLEVKLIALLCPRYNVQGVPKGERIDHH